MKACKTCKKLRQELKETRHNVMTLMEAIAPFTGGMTSRKDNESWTIEIKLDPKVFKLGSRFQPFYPFEYSKRLEEAGFVNHHVSHEIIEILPPSNNTKEGTTTSVELIPGGKARLKGKKSLHPDALQILRELSQKRKARALKIAFEDQNLTTRRFDMANLAGLSLQDLQPFLMKDIIKALKTKSRNPKKGPAISEKQGLCGGFNGGRRRKGK